MVCQKLRENAATKKSIGRITFYIPVTILLHCIDKPSDNSMTQVC